MRYWVQVLGTNTVDSKPSLMFHFDSQRYLFNCGEGTQRFVTEHTIRLVKMRNIFLTRLDWDCIGGLPGMLLTLGDVGTSKLKVFGPENTTRVLASTRHFIYRSSVSLETHEFSTDGARYADENLNIEATTLYPSSSIDDQPQISLFSHQTPMQKQSEPQSKERIIGRKRKLSRLSSISKERCSSAKELVKQMFGATGVDSTAKKVTGCIDDINEISMDDEAEKEQSIQLEGAGTDQLKNGRPIPSTVCYILTGPEVCGKFDVDTARNLGLKPGPLYGRLQRGQSVTLENGTTIHPHQVLSPSKPGAVFIILDVPDTSYITSVLTNSALAPYLSKDGVTTMLDSSSSSNLVSKVLCVYHMLGDGVIDSPQYQHFMNQFHRDVQHFIFNSEHCAQPLVFTASGISQSNMHYLDPSVFPLHYQSVKAKRLLDDVPELPMNTTVARPLLSYLVEPSAKFIDDTFRDFEYSKTLTIINEKLPRYREAVNTTHRILKDHNLFVLPVDNTQFIIATLGTGSAIPSKYRNVSSTVLSTPVGGILLDCGEGTLGQLFRLLGVKDAEEHNIPSTTMKDTTHSQQSQKTSLIQERYPSLTSFFDNLRLIFISHMHADHHLGLVRILSVYAEQRRQRARSTNPLKEKLVLIAPFRMHHFLTEYDAVVPIQYTDSVDFIDCESLLYKPRLKDHMWEEYDCTDWRIPYGRICTELQLKSIKTVDVIHCPWSYGVVIEGAEVVTFSGDTRPSDRLIEAGQNSDLLIHEATLEDGMELEAFTKKHCTTSEAIRVFERMNAKKLLLTHFSQRYPRMPHIKYASHPKDKIAIAFDLLTFGTKTEFAMLPLYVEPLGTLCQAQEVRERTQEQLQNSVFTLQEKRKKKGQKQDQLKK